MEKENVQVKSVEDKDWKCSIIN